MIDPCKPLQHNPPALFNSSARFGDRNIKADSRHCAVFFCPSCTTGAPSSMAGRGGDTFGYAGSFMPVRQPCHVPAPFVWRRGAGFTLIKEAHHA